MNVGPRARPWRRRALTIALLSIGLGACTGSPHPDLHRLYESRTPTTQQPPLVVIPGILGSRLRERASGREIWPGSPLQAILGDPHRLALHIDPDTLEPRDDGIEAYDVFDQLLGTDYYGDLLETLENAGGYQRTRAGQPLTTRIRRYYVFAYDWRQDNVVSARKLDALIEQIRADHGDPLLRVDVVAHSMGGLIVRYYLRYGTRDVLDSNELPISYAGTRKIRTAVLLGTPNLGSASSLHGFIIGTPVGFRRVPPEVLATMPSTYQLFPHPLQDWLVTAAGAALDRDLFDPAIWRAFQWSIYDPEVRRRISADRANNERAAAEYEVLQRYFDRRLARARRFVWALTRQLDHSPERLIVFGGDCELTPARLLVEEIDGDSVVRLYPDELRSPRDGVNYRALMLEPGDGIVTKASLLGRERLDPNLARHRFAFFPLAYSMFLCEAHNRLTGNASFQDNLLNVLLDNDQPFDQRPAVGAHTRSAADALIF